MVGQPDTGTVAAARAGDPAAVDRLVAGYLPLVYTIVGRALEGHADVDDVVQDVMLRVLRNLGELRDPAAFRSWLVAITVRQVRERFRGRPPAVPLDPDLRDPGADFTDLAITRLELSGQRRETAEATRWLDEDNRELLALWWLEASGELTRDEIVEATGVGRQHAAVRVQRMKGQLETARVVVRALRPPHCPDLAGVLTGWDGRPGPLWRKRIARHTRDCRDCAPAWQDLVAAERLLAGMALVPLPPHLGLSTINTLSGTATPSTTAAQAVPAKLAAKAGVPLTWKALAGVLAAAAVAGAGVAVQAYREPAEPIAPAAVVAPQAPPVSPPPAVPSAPASAVPSPSRSASPSATRNPAATRKPSAAPVSVKKGAGVWRFAGAEAALKDVGAGWYYDWAPSDDEVPGPAGVEFVPMIWGAADVTDATLKRAAAEGDVLLGFNEPDLPEQSNMTVEAALAAWPRLQATGMRLVSPAVAVGADTPGGWLDRFMTGAAGAGLRVDAIALHWYGSDFSAAAVNQFLGYVDAVHERYGKPVWVTEFGLIDFGGSPRYPNDAQKVRFIQGAAAGLEKRSYVERYAWFGLPAVGDSVDFGLYLDGDSPTEAGKAYRGI
ncbi:sigma-70 family RNA polymerase sigma factor [Actinoplanes sp. NEAU-A12]|uniref:RNA polymerase sigma factor n=1 Tax=Actinoplanes sandaracinus TaxID=3045177 RepID=A0ABT6WP96_9ACTN|nr:sigma-70 family RNA polymerase sigma factor [Actinoplanes sandaracinus]MDI6101558.1 sigma-70 family RNA polymerase sigma factor [Actinoplanes sandaracinus]